MHITQKIFENVCTLVEKTKTIFASCKKVWLNFCKRVEKIKSKLASCEKKLIILQKLTRKKTCELIFAHVENYKSFR